MSAVAYARAPQQQQAVRRRPEIARLVLPQQQVAYQHQPEHQTMVMEAPFGWVKDSFTSLERKNGFAVATLSFTATRKSKVLGYVPFVGTVIGIQRFRAGQREQEHFKNIHLHTLANIRTKPWQVRGAIECVPVIGGLTCLITDLALTDFRASTKGRYRLMKLPEDVEHGICKVCNLQVLI